MKARSVGGASMVDNEGEMYPNLMHGGMSSEKFANETSAAEVIRAAMQKIQLEMEETKRQQSLPASSSRRSLISTPSQPTQQQYESHPSKPAEFDVSAYIALMKREIELVDNRPEYDPSRASSSSRRAEHEEPYDPEIQEAILEKQAKKDLEEAAQDIKATVEDVEEEEEEPATENDDEPDTKGKKKVSATKRGGKRKTASKSSKRKVVSKKIAGSSPSSHPSEGSDGENE